MLRTDVRAFSTLMSEAIEGMAVWSTAAGDRWSADLVEALVADGRQAHLRLVDDAGEPEGPLIQYLDGRVSTVDGREILPMAGMFPWSAARRSAPAGWRTSGPLPMSRWKSRTPSRDWSS